MSTLRAAALLPLLTSGCVATAVYGLPRPIDPGTVQATLMLENFVRGDAIFNPDHNAPDPDVASPLPGPGLELRFGITQGFDLGARLSAGSGLMVDGKIGLLEDRDFALSLDPAIGIARFAYVSSRDDISGQASVRLLGSWRASSIVELAGHVNVGVLRDVNKFEGNDLVPTGGVGVGPLFHFTKSFALQPSVTMLWRSDRVSWNPEVAAGLGFVFGSGVPSPPSPESPPTREPEPEPFDW